MCVFLFSNLHRHMCSHYCLIDHILRILNDKMLGLRLFIQKVRIHMH